MRAILLLAAAALGAQDARPAKLEIASQRDTPPAKFPGDVFVNLGVKNAGSVEAREPTAVLTLSDRALAPVRKLRVRLADGVAPGAEDAFEITVPRCPDYATVRAEVIWLTAEVGGPGAELSKAERVEVGGCRLVRFTDGSLRVTGKLRNGTRRAARNVAVAFRLGSLEHTHTVAGPVGPGKVRDLEFFVPDCPPCEGYSYSIGHEECDDEAEPEAEPAPAVRRTSHQGAAPEPKPEDAPPPPPAKTTYTVEVRGLKWLTGYQMVNKKYSGDVAFLKLMIRDADGRPAQPTGKFVVTIYESDKARGQVTRYLKKESWGLDAAKIDSKNVSHEIVACEKTTTGVLWLGLVRSERIMIDLKVDVTLTLDKIGTWEWKGLEEEFEAKPRGPDKAAEKK